MNLFEQLQQPFPRNKVHWRVGNTNAKRLGCKPHEATEGSVLAYIDARDVMGRLDKVVGPENWQCRYPLADSGLLICEVGLCTEYAANQSGDRYPIPHQHKTEVVSGDWAWKANGAGDTQVEAEKGKCSDAFKRAAVLWGIGRYLYALPFSWVALKNGKPAVIPGLPTWATPEGFEAIMDKRSKAE